MTVQPFSQYTVILLFLMVISGSRLAEWSSAVLPPNTSICTKPFPLSKLQSVSETSQLVVNTSGYVGQLVS